VPISSTEIERKSLEAHVDLCAIRYEQLDARLNKVEEKLDTVIDTMSAGQNSLVKVIIGAAGTIVAGLLSTIVVIILQM
jgi:tetrahydromethanopterin S-methyltransferase subunit G